MHWRARSLPNRLLRPSIADSDAAAGDPHAQRLTRSVVRLAEQGDVRAQTRLG